MTNVDLNAFKKIYFLGIGGIGMSALARYFNLKGFEVSGYDKTPSPLTDTLIEEGISIHFEDLGEKIGAQIEKESTLVIFTPAIPKDMLEYNYIVNQNFKILKRAQILGLITHNSKGLCVAGTHGKTTTSTMLAHILFTSSLKCNAFLGGISTNYNTNFIASATSEYTVIEADEFDRSFLQLNPFASIITACDADHLDIYGDEETFLKGFQSYADLINTDGVLVIKKGLPLKRIANTLTYSLTEEADFQGKNLRYENGLQVIDVYFEGHVWESIALGLPGIHNAENALACIALCVFLELSEQEIRHGLESFSGVKRRFEYHVKSNNIVYIDDYAHHPTELKALIDSVRLLYPTKQISIVFQPHLFSRTNDFMEDFARELSQVDNLYLLPIYPARELPMEGVTSDVLLAKISCQSKQLVNKEELLNRIELTSNQVILSVGAGDIDRLVKPLKEKILSYNAAPLNL
jgi:UDP-N-acetylmuramate--alanine ligase